MYTISCKASQRKKKCVLVRLVTPVNNLTTLTTVSDVSTVTTVTTLTTITTFPIVTTIIVKYQMLLFYQGRATNNTCPPTRALQGSHMNYYTKFQLSDVKITPNIGQIRF